jgi:hypothetical protein
MRVFRLCTSVVALTVLAACGDNTTNPSSDASGGGGKLTLVFQPSNPPQATGLSLTQAHVQVEAVAVIGDLTPDYRTMLTGETHVDMLGMPLTHVFDQAPQGLYSRVHFLQEEITFQGTYNGMPIQAQFEYETSIDLRDPVGQDVWPNHNAVFTVSFDGSNWFAGNVLSQAVVVGGQIVIDRVNNIPVGQAIAHNVAAAISLSTAQGPN